MAVAVAVAVLASFHMEQRSRYPSISTPNGGSTPSYIRVNDVNDNNKNNNSSSTSSGGGGGGGGGGGDGLSTTQSASSSGSLTNLSTVRGFRDFHDHDSWYSQYLPVTAIELPIVTWIRGYSQADLAADLVSGVTVFALVTPSAH